MKSTIVQLREKEAAINAAKKDLAAFRKEINLDALIEEAEFDLSNVECELPSLYTKWNLACPEHFKKNCRCRVCNILHEESNIMKKEIKVLKSRLNKFEYYRDI